MAKISTFSEEVVESDGNYIIQATFLATVCVIELQLNQGYKSIPASLHAVCIRRIYGLHNFMQEPVEVTLGGTDKVYYIPLEMLQKLLILVYVYNRYWQDYLQFNGAADNKGILM